MKTTQYMLGGKRLYITAAEANANTMVPLFRPVGRALEILGDSSLGDSSLEDSSLEDSSLEASRADLGVVRGLEDPTGRPLPRLLIGLTWKVGSYKASAIMG